MKYVAPLLVIDDMERSKQFYSEVLGLCVICDFGANVTLTGGMSLQTRESWKDFIHKPDGQIVYHGNEDVYKRQFYYTSFHFSHRHAVQCYRDNNLTPRILDKQI